MILSSNKENNSHREGERNKKKIRENEEKCTSTYNIVVRVHDGERE